MPADILLINVGQKSAFFDTVNLNGETMLQQKYPICENVSTNEIQGLKGAIIYEDTNPSMETFRGEISLNHDA